MKKKYDIAITCGVFDCFHKGHKELLDYMNELADETLIIIHDDYSTFENKERVTIQDLEQRTKALQHFYLMSNNEKYPDISNCYQKDPSSHLDYILDYEKSENLYKINNKKIVYVRGDDWQDFPGRKTIEKHNIPIKFKPYTKGISTTLIRENLETAKCGCKLEMEDGSIFDPEIKNK